VKPVLKAHIAVLCTNLFFAANYSFIKLISPDYIQPFGLNIYRVGISLILFWLVWMFGKTKAGIERKDWGRFLLCGLTGVAINQMFFLKGLTMTTTVHGSLLMLTTPLLITVFALWVLKENITSTKAAGLALGICGAGLLIFSKGDGAEGSNYIWGDILILINAISYSIYFILVKPLMLRYSSLQVIRWVFTFGFIMLLPFGWNEATQVDFQSFHWQQAAALIALIFTGTFLAYIFNAFGIQQLGASITGSYIYTQPVFAVLIAALLLGERLTVHKLIAAVLIFSGVYLVGIKKKS
jgi:drug/metabolite transporter (DMT)-like permease